MKKTSKLSGMAYPAGSRYRKRKGKTKIRKVLDSTRMIIEKAIARLKFFGRG